MFFQYSDGKMTSVDIKDIRDDTLTAGYLNASGTDVLSTHFGFAESTVKACMDANKTFRSGVEMHKDYTFTELRILNTHEESDDYIALYIKKNLVLVVDVCDYDGSTKNKFLASIEKYSPDKVNCVKIIAAFIDSLLSADQSVMESFENELSDREDELIEGDVGKDFNIRLLKIKKQLSKRQNYYAQLLDITDAVSENDNDIFDDSDMIYIDNVSKRISRLRDEAISLKNTLEHLQDAYSTNLDMKMNKTMKIFTVLTSIFFPLTIIVGWYGMNFESMPEFRWRFGYAYVIALSVVVVVILAIIGKKKKWF